MVWKFVIIFLLFCQSLHPFTVFESISFYQEMLKRVNDSDKKIIRDLMKSKVYKSTLDPHNIEILKRLEIEGIVSS